MAEQEEVEFPDEVLASISAHAGRGIFDYNADGWTTVTAHKYHKTSSQCETEIAGLRPGMPDYLLQCFRLYVSEYNSYRYFPEFKLK